MLWKDPVPWDNHQGRVTLAGDAAHAMPPRKYSISPLSIEAPC